MPKQKVIKKSALSPTVLIAGGAGFIGSHLAKKFLDEGARVVVLDNFRTGKDIYIKSLLDNDKFAFFDANINDGIPSNIQSVDYIVHLASVESYLYSRDQVNLDSLLTNALGTKNLLDFAQKAQAKFLLVSSIDVYEGLMSPLNLDEYFGHTQEEEKRYSLSEAKRFAEALVWEYYKKNDTNVRIVRLPEVYGPRMNLDSTGALGKFLKEVVNSHSLTIKGEGTEKEYYLYITDVIGGLVKSLFKKSTKGQIYTLAPKEPHTILETGYLVKSLANSNVDINFKPKTYDSTYRSPRIPDLSNLSELDWSPQINMKRGVKNTLDWLGYESNENSFKPNRLAEKKKKEKEVKKGISVTSLADFREKPQEEKTPKKQKVKKIKKERFTPFKKVKGWFSNVQFKQKTWLILLPILALLMALVIPPAQTYLFAKSGYKNLEKARASVENANPQQSMEYTNKAFQNFTKAQNSLKKLSWYFQLTGTEEQHSSLSSLLSSTIYFSKGAYDTAKSAEPFLEIWGILKPSSSEQLDPQDFADARTNLNEAKNSFQRAEAELKNVDVATLPNSIKQDVIIYSETLGTIVESVDTAKVLASETPKLLGVNDQTQTYLILFQNSNELRPTGGFIGSYSILELKNGKIENLTIDDIYNPDGQIDVQNIETGEPKKVGELVEEDKQYIRNANWNPDFVKSAEDITNLYQQVTQKEVDGVIGIDLYFVENLLKMTGPIYLTAYGEEISAHNLYERAQYHSGFNYENGSDQKKAFLTVLGSKLLENIFALDNEQLPGVIDQIQSSLAEKHLLISLSNSTLSAELNKQNWDGGLVSTNEDYLYVVNANVGGTKSNYYVDNNMVYDVSSKTRDGLLRAKVTLNYEHNGEDESWPGGPYTNYVRVLTQNGTKLTGANFTKSDGTSEDIFENVTIDQIGKYTSYEYLIEINPQETATLSFNYDLPESLSITKDNMDYVLYWQKQPGTQGNGVDFMFEPPFGTTTVDETEIETELNTDKIFAIDLK